MQLCRPGFYSEVVSHLYRGFYYEVPNHEKKNVFYKTGESYVYGTVHHLYS